MKYCNDGSTWPARVEGFCLFMGYEGRDGAKYRGSQWRLIGQVYVERDRLQWFPCESSGVSAPE